MPTQKYSTPTPTPTLRSPPYTAPSPSTPQTPEPPTLQLPPPQPPQSLTPPPPPPPPPPILVGTSGSRAMRALQLVCVVRKASTLHASSSFRCGETAFPMRLVASGRASKPSCLLSTSVSTSGSSGMSS